MGADPTVFAKMYEFLAKDFDEQPDVVKEERRRIAKFIYKMPDAKWAQSMGDFDFNDDDLDAYEDLGVLGIANLCEDCNYHFTKWSKDQHGKGKCDQ